MTCGCGNAVQIPPPQGGGICLFSGLKKRAARRCDGHPAISLYSEPISKLQELCRVRSTHHNFWCVERALQIHWSATNELKNLFSNAKAPTLTPTLSRLRERGQSILPPWGKVWMGAERKVITMGCLDLLVHPSGAGGWRINPIKSSSATDGHGFTQIINELPFSSCAPFR